MKKHFFLLKKKREVDFSTAKGRKITSAFCSLCIIIYCREAKEKNNIQFYIKFWSVWIRLLIYWLFHFSLLIFDFCCKSKTEVPICIPIISNANFLLYVYKEKSPSQIANCRNMRNMLSILLYVAHFYIPKKIGMNSLMTSTFRKAQGLGPSEINW